LYLNEDRTTARLNLRIFIAGWPYEPEDLRDDSGPVLVHASIPADQRVVDAHTRRGLAGAGLPTTYPLDEDGRLIGHDRCQIVGLAAKRAGLRGVRARSARSPDGAGRDIAWFPATRRSRARSIKIETFESWYLG
jgi:hypothetical protein